MATAKESTRTPRRTRKSKEGSDPHPLEGFSESLEIHESTGVLLNTEDPNYDARKEIEDLRAELQAEKMKGQEQTAEASEEIVAAQLAVEKARLVAELREARNATEAVQPAAQAAVAQVELTSPDNNGSES